VEIIDNDATIEPKDRLQDGFAPANLPPAAPDGGPIPEAAPIYLPVVTVSLCDRGPCRRRHLFTASMEAMTPEDGSELERPKLDERGEPIVKRIEPDVIAWNGETRPGQTIYETEPYTPRQVIRACYPSPGVKIELGEDEPVLECSLWDPEDPTDLEVLAREARRARYLASDAASAADVEDLNREDSAASLLPNGVKRKK
jgi:hypothetical protein